MQRISWWLLSLAIASHVSQSMFAVGFSTTGKESRRILRSSNLPNIGANFQSSFLIKPRGAATSSLSRSATADDDTSSSTSIIWLPKLRKIMAGIALAGAAETSYLTYTKLTHQVDSLWCGASDSSAMNCHSVLTGPYSNFPFTKIPLSALGLVAYLVTIGLALQPLISYSNADDSESSVVEGDDTWNRIALTTVTTGMATFSIFLMSLLFGILHTFCPYCVFSAVCSIVLAKLAWIGGCLPTPPQDDTTSDGINTPLGGSPALEIRKAGAQAVTSSFLAATLTAVALFVSVDDSVAAISSFPSISAGNQPQQEQLYAPPAITTESSQQALQIASDLQGMQAKMYGAYWCSHCYDQKEALGKQAFSKVEYVECSRDGVNSQTKVCKAKQVPGYPTWEINGELYPGEKDLDELQELLTSIKSGNSVASPTES